MRRLSQSWYARDMTTFSELTLPGASDAIEVIVHGAKPTQPQRAAITHAKKGTLRVDRCGRRSLSLRCVHGFRVRRRSRRTRFHGTRRCVS